MCNIFVLILYAVYVLYGLEESILTDTITDIIHMLLKFTAANITLPDSFLSTAVQ